MRAWTLILLLATCLSVQAKVCQKQFGNLVCGQGTVDQVTHVGAAVLKGTTVTDNASFTGSSTLKNVTINHLTSTGSIKIEDSHLKSMNATGPTKIVDVHVDKATVTGTAHINQSSIKVFKGLGALIANASDIETIENTGSVSLTGVTVKSANIYNLNTHIDAGQVDQLVNSYDQEEGSPVVCLSGNAKVSSIKFAEKHGTVYVEGKLDHEPSITNGKLISGACQKGNTEDDFFLKF